MQPPPAPSKHSRSLGLVLALAFAAAGAGGTRWWFASRPPNAALDRLVNECEIEMVRGTCRVQSGDSAASPLDSVVFVAGVGRIDATSYRRLRDAGQALCSTVRSTCSRDWNGAECRAARALHGQP